MLTDNNSLLLLLVGTITTVGITLYLSTVLFVTRTIILQFVVITTIIYGMFIMVAFSLGKFFSNLRVYDPNTGRNREISKINIQKQKDCDHEGKCKCEIELMEEIFGTIKFIHINNFSDSLFDD